MAKASSLAARLAGCGASACRTCSSRTRPLGPSTDLVMSRDGSHGGRRTVAPPRHRDVGRAVPVAARDGGGRHLRAGALRRAAGGRVLRAHPDDVPGFLRCHSASRRVAVLCNAALCERRTRTTILLCEHCLRRVGTTMAVPATEETRYARNG